MASEPLQKIYDFLSDHPIELGVVAISIVALFIQMKGTKEITRTIKGVTIRG